MELMVSAFITMVIDTSSFAKRKEKVGKSLEFVVRCAILFTRTHTYDDMDR